MAKHQTITYSDDFGGQGEAQPVRFSFDGQLYEVDLNKQHTNSFTKQMKKYIEAARPLGNGDTSVDYAAVRAWARQQGIVVPDRGLIAGEVIKQYTLATA